MRILVTGAEGFVGKHLVEELQANGHQVVASDIHDTNLALAWEPFSLVSRAHPDYVIHLAARYGRILCRNQPHRSVSDNAAATTEIALACARLEIPVLYTSTSEVYGDHGEETISEESELLMPTTIYGLSKRWGEEALRLYVPPENLCIVRPNMLYGPGQKYGHGHCALATFIHNAQNNLPLDVHRDASRSWLYVGDAVRALRLLAEGGHRGVFNMGNHMGRCSIENLAAMVCKLTDSKSEIRVSDAPADQIRHKNYDSTKLLRTLSWAPWRPTVHLQSGIEAMLSC